jgi:hypothetical protein
MIYFDFEAFQHIVLGLIFQICDPGYKTIITPNKAN